MRRFSFVVAAHHADAFVAALDDIPGLSVYAQAEPSPRGEGEEEWTVSLLCGDGQLAVGAETRMRRVAETLDIPYPALSTDQLPDRDWVAVSEQRLGAIKVGRFRVHGRHIAASTDPSLYDIVVEAGRAFGSGHHATTRGCLAAIEIIARRRRVVRALDLGTGSGVLAIAMARRMRIPVTAIDIDPTAVSVAAENVHRNGVANLVHTVVGNGLWQCRPRQTFDLVVANILAEPLIRSAPAIARLARHQASLVLSGISIRQQAAVAAAYRRSRFVLVARSVEGDWPTLILERNRERR